MERNKTINAHDLHPADYCFDYGAFEADPEAYIFTPEDIAYLNAQALEKYEFEVPMTPYEKRALRKWVREGHSPYENAGSKYLCFMETGSCDFLEVYRLDREIDQELKGMSKAKREMYLKEYTGWSEESA